MFINRLKKFGKLRIKIPQEIFPCSDKKTEWICDCGKEKFIQIKYVISGNTTTCGRCNEISAEEMSTRKFGKLRIKTPQDILLRSHKKIEWICDCSKETQKQICNVTNGHTTSCGHCSEISANIVSEMKFGKLRIKTPQNINPGSAKKIRWVCDCSKETITRIHLVLSGKTSSCGNCHGTIFDWYFTNKEKIRSLKYPIRPSQIPIGGITPIEIITKPSKRFKTICPSCRKSWMANWADIRFGRALTCGCGYNRISEPQRRILEFVKTYDPDAQLEYKLESSYYDIFVPSKNLLIEYDGAMWHTDRSRDLRKHELALTHQYKFMRILEKDWKKNKQEIYDKLTIVMKDADAK